MTCFRKAPAALALLLLAFGSAPVFGQTPAASLPRQMIATAHPLASQAGLKMLRRGGTAVDAAIAAALVLSVVEPHASGLGGGALMLAWDDARGKLRSFDGVSSAPLGVGPSLLSPQEQEPARRDFLLRSARAAAVPGEVALLAKAHAALGRLPWESLFTPAIEAAETGFAMPRELAIVLQRNPKAYAAVPTLRRLYFDADGKPLPVGTTVRNPEQAEALKRIAAQGPAVACPQRRYHLES